MMELIIAFAITFLFLGVFLFFANKSMNHKTTELSPYSFNDLNLFREWFNALYDVRPDFLEEDFILFVKLHKSLNIKIPKKINEEIQKYKGD